MKPRTETEQISELVRSGKLKRISGIPHFSWGPGIEKGERKPFDEILQEVRDSEDEKYDH